MDLSSNRCGYAIFDVNLQKATLLMSYTPGEPGGLKENPTKGGRAPSQRSSRGHGSGFGQIMRKLNDLVV